MRAFAARVLLPVSRGLSAALTCLLVLLLQGLLRSLGSEAEALQKIHVRIQRQLQNLEVSQLMHDCAVATACHACGKGTQTCVRMTA